MSKRKAALPTTAELRNAILLRMGPPDGPCYAEGAAKLLDAYVSKLEQHWRWVEGYKVQLAAENAVREAVGRIGQRRSLWKPPN